MVGLEDHLARVGPLARRQLAGMELGDRGVVAVGGAGLAGALLEAAELVRILDEVALIHQLPVAGDRPLAVPVAPATFRIPASAAA